MPASRLRMCFASPSHDEIRGGVAVLSEVCRKEFGVPARIANVEKKTRGVTIASTGLMRRMAAYSMTASARSCSRTAVFAREPTSLRQLIWQQCLPKNAPG